MKRTLVVSLCLVIAALPSSAAPKWLRKASAIAACAASAADLGTTAYGVSHGGHELNSLLTNSRRQVRWGLNAGVNVGICASAIAAAKLRQVPDALAIPLDGGIAAAKGTFVIHNLGQMGTLQ